MSEELFENDADIFTLTDEDGVETDFEVVGSCEYEGGIYFAVIPMTDGNDGDSVEYTILKSAKDDDGEDIFVTVDDDDEFDAVADIFEDELFSEADYGADE